jgi:aldose 1-epimerase
MPLTAPLPTSEPFGQTSGGEPVELWRLTSASGVSAQILTYGGILHALDIPDRDGRTASVVLSLPDVKGYEDRSPYFGALIGRYANRIAHGRFVLDGQAYELPVNDRGHTLHGGPEGFHRQVWAASALPGALRLTLSSPDGEMGFPGELQVTATYALADDGTLTLDFEAGTDRPTVVTLTNHAYFNLAGAGSEGGILRHTLRIDADRYLPVTDEGIPLGPQRDVAGTAFDFTAAREVGPGVTDPDPQITAAGGYDHCYVLRPAAEGAPARLAAVLHDPDSGRTMEVRTTEPGLQLYSGNYLDGSLTDGEGRPFGRYSALCLETQHLPDSPNQPDYPSTTLRPGDVLRTRTEWAFPHLAAPDAT